MKTKVISIILAFCMVLGMLPTAYALEDGAGTAARIEIDGNVACYSSLSLAIAAVPDGGTITLTANASGTVTVSREVVFRLDTGSYHCELQAGAGFQMTVEGDLYIVTAIRIPGAALHNISIVASEGGTVVADPDKAPAGRAVLLTVTPDEGYALKSLSATDAVGCTVPIIALSETRYMLRMPVSDITVTAAFQEIHATSPADCPRDQSCPAAQFTDLNLSLWYHDGIHYVIEHHLMYGTGEHRFSPNSATTRAMLVTVLFRLDGAQCEAQCPFTDVAADAWYAEAVTWAANNHIVVGYGGGCFGPEDPITREQMANILWRYAAHRGYDVSAMGDLNAFVDGDDTAQWARRGMEWAVGSGIIVGKGNRRLDPQGYAVRSEFATMLMKFCTVLTK